MKYLVFAFLLLSHVCLAQPGNPLQPLLDFDKAFSDAVGDANLKQLTELQLADKIKEIDRTIIPLLKNKTWRFVVKVKDVAAGDGTYEITHEGTIPLMGSKCNWSLAGESINLKLPKATAEKIRKGDYLEFSGTPFRVSETNTAAQNTDINRRINRGLALQVLVITKDLYIDVIVTEAKPVFFK